MIKNDEGGRREPELEKESVGKRETGESRIGEREFKIKWEIKRGRDRVRKERGIVSDILRRSKR